MLSTKEIKDYFINNQNKIKKIVDKETDGSVNFDIDKVLKIIDLFENYVPKKKYIKNALPILTNGNLYTTLFLSLFANFNKMQIVIDVNENFPLSNKEIASIFDKNVKIVKIDSQMLYNFSISQESDCIWVIDSTSKFHSIMDKSYPAKNIKLMSLEMYIDENKFNDITEIIENYCDINLIELDLHKNFTPNHILKRAELQNGTQAFLIFTKSPANFENISQKEKQIYINFNPFDRFEIDMCKKFLNKF